MRVFVVDIEASGLHGWPIEIGWSLAGSGLYQSFLIKPDASWDLDLWDPCAEDIHHISLEMLDIEGQSIDQVVDAFLRDTDGATLISDAPGFDQKWLDQLFDAASSFTTKGRSPVIQSIQSAFPNFNISHDPEERQHRAGPDALDLSESIRRWTVLSTPFPL